MHNAHEYDHAFKEIHAHDRTGRQQKSPTYATSTSAQVP